MLVVVVVLFAVCWLPLHAFMLVIDFNPELTNYKSTAQKRFFTGVYYCVHWLAMSNSFVNPIIYGFLNDCFRVSNVYARSQLSRKPNYTENCIVNIKLYRLSRRSKTAKIKLIYKL